MLFLNAGFWPLLWAVVGGGAAATALLTLFVATVSRPRRQQAPMPAQAVPGHRDATTRPARAA